MRTAALAGFSLAAILLAGCDSLREEAGLNKLTPDEFAVVTKAPLIIPPDFNLKPPAPGSAPLNQQDPTGEAQKALFASSDPAVIAANMKGDMTMGEKMLLAQAGARRSDPNIRGQLQSDAPGMQGADPNFTNQVLAGQTTPVPNQSLRNPRARKKKSGWFDWL
jgi:hypothetical protein